MGDCADHFDGYNWNEDDLEDGMTPHQPQNPVEGQGEPLFVIGDSRGMFSKEQIVSSAKKVIDYLHAQLAEKEKECIEQREALDKNFDDRMQIHSEFLAKISFLSQQLAKAREEASRICWEYGSICNVDQNDGVDRERNIVRRDTAYHLAKEILELNQLPADASHRESGSND